MKKIQIPVPATIEEMQSELRCLLPDNVKVLTRLSRELCFSRRLKQSTGFRISDAALVFSHDSRNAVIIAESGSDDARRLAKVLAAADIELSIAHPIVMEPGAGASERRERQPEWTAAFRELADGLDPTDLRALVQRRYAIEKHFEGAAIDIDFLCKAGDEFIVIEYKMKEKTKNGTFGMNYGQVECLKKLAKSINVVNINESNKDKCVYMSFMNSYIFDLNDQDTNFAPKDTSIKMDKVQKYYVLPEDKFVRCDDMTCFSDFILKLVCGR